MSTFSVVKMAAGQTGARPADGADGEVIVAWQEHRPHLLNIAYRLLGSVSDAEDMAQEAYLRLLKADLREIDDVGGWLVVVVTRICLDHLRSARMRRETQPGPWLPEPIVGEAGALLDPADIVTLDESVRMGLLIVLERLTPAERVVFVLHDVFTYPFEEIAPMVARTPAACRQLASRARRRIDAERGRSTAVDPGEMRAVAERFIAACEGADLQPLLEVLDPNVVGWVDLGEAATPFPQPSVGPQQVAGRAQALFGRRSGINLSVASVNGEVGLLATFKGRIHAVLVLLVREHRIAAIYSIADPHKLARLPGNTV